MLWIACGTMLNLDMVQCTFILCNGYKLCSICDLAHVKMRRLNLRNAEHFFRYVHET